MIIQSANELRQQLQEYGRLKQNESQIISIQHTAKALATAQSQLKAWVEIYLLLLSYFSEPQRHELSRQATEIQRKVNECKERFQNASRYPQEPLKQLQRLSEKLTESTTEAWGYYAQNRFAPLRETIQTARRLPKMQPKLAQVGGIFKDVEAQSRKLPRCAADIQHFHDQLDVIKRQLQTVEPIDEQQRAFLEKVQLGTATVADLDETLLQWCKQQGLAAQLKLISKV